ncbi:enamine deaminase RidA (YjgF/YER057c/UK114 family) [Paraburkholderia sp. BL23I1N1]|uniref:RidA family protein n=1 Tax=Paraburkholderia sp. BL23I1N1 TaxID=1938802 RepID=UPI000E7649C0|nr:RidA family protein [Paraburkholderia sp. BL23I1N1]RKE36489.1 enamine deaminase RidA (YjgF/YER057c/UK114 family) [Paraburkholderia sp. BL23I1N1]
MTMSTTRQSIIPPPFQAFYDAYHFSPATRVGDTIWVSGQVGIGPDMKAGEGMPAQARIAFESLKAVLETAGASLSDVVELTTFHTDLRGEIEAFSAVKDAYFPARYPSWTAVGVTQLALPELCIEIRAVAVSGCGEG